MTTLYEMQNLADGSIVFKPVTAPAPMETGARLDVPWMSQLGAGADYGIGDCAEACVAMVLRFLGKPIESIDQVSMAAGLPRGFTVSAWWDAVRAAGMFGVVLEHAHSQKLEQLISELHAGRPVIVLLNYQSIPIPLRSSATYNNGHFVVAVGCDEQSLLVHDPYWPAAQQGSFLRYTRADFDRAWSTRAPGNTLVRQALLLRS